MDCYACDVGLTHWHCPTCGAPGDEAGPCNSCMLAESPLAPAIGVVLVILPIIVLVFAWVYLFAPGGKG